MRVIAGEHKGRRLKTVPGQETRPTSDKIKEAIFHRMGPFFEDGQGLDLFAGSGSLGIEALSRGMSKMFFVDKSPKAVKTIHDNINLLGVKANSEVYRNDALRALEALSKKDEQLSLILFDPPYDQGLYQKVIDKIALKKLLQTGGLLYMEHRPELTFTLPKDVEPIFEKRYNDTTMATILEKN